MEKESSNGPIRALSKAISMKTILKVLVNIGGPMAESTMVNGSTIKWKGTALLPGLMVESMSVNIKTIKNMVKVLLSGLMVENI